MDRFKTSIKNSQNKTKKVLLYCVCKTDWIGPHKPIIDVNLS